MSIHGAADATRMFAETYGDLIAAVRKMRREQRSEQLDRGAMEKLRIAEDEVDRLLAELDGNEDAEASVEARANIYEKDESNG